MTGSVPASWGAPSATLPRLLAPPSSLSLARAPARAAPSEQGHPARGRMNRTPLICDVDVDGSDFFGTCDASKMSRIVPAPSKSDMYEGSSQFLRTREPTERASATQSAHTLRGHARGAHSLSVRDRVPTAPTAAVDGRLRPPDRPIPGRAHGRMGGRY